MGLSDFSRYAMAATLIVFMLPSCHGQDPASLESRVKSLEDLTKKLADRMTGQDGDMAWLSRSSVPVGAVVAFAGAWPPVGTDLNNKPWTEDSIGWILCDGRSLADAKYAALRTVLNKNSAPNFKGMFLRGYNPDSTGLDAGHRLGDTEQDDFKSHGHTARSTTTFDHTHLISGPAGQEDAGRWGIMPDAQGGGNNAVARFGYPSSIKTTGVASGSPDTKTTIVENGGTETRPVNVAVNYIIRFKVSQ